LIGEAAGKPSSRELGSPKRSSTLIPSSMIKGIINVGPLYQRCLVIRGSIQHSFIEFPGPLNTRWLYYNSGREGVRIPRSAPNVQGDIADTHSDVTVNATASVSI
jgi:hypothetical protein